MGEELNAKLDHKYIVRIVLVWGSVNVNWLSFIKLNSLRFVANEIRLKWGALRSSVFKVKVGEQNPILDSHRLY